MSTAMRRSASSSSAAAAMRKEEENAMSTMSGGVAAAAAPAPPQCKGADAGGGDDNEPPRRRLPFGRIDLNVGRRISASTKKVWRKKPAPTSTSRSRSASAIAAPASPELVAPQRTQSQPLPSSSALGPEETRSVAEEEPVAAEAGGGPDGIFRLGTFAQADDDSSSFWSEERSSLLTLKRANPVFDSVDSEDEDEYDYQSDRECDYGLSSPFKRMRSSFLEEACDLADRRGEEEDEERLQDGARDAPAAAAAAAVSSSSTTLALGLGPGQSYYLPRTLWKMPSGEPFLGDTDDESESSDDCDRQGAACSEIF